MTTLLLASLVAAVVRWYRNRRRLPADLGDSDTAQDQTPDVAGGDPSDVGHLRGINP